MEPITVSIQEIVHEFEELVRFEERIITLDEIDMLDESDCEEFLNETEQIAQKYIMRMSQLPFKGYMRRMRL